jgi:alpha-tubulin suppressor-like RCC1 family protein
MDAANVPDATGDASDSASNVSAGCIAQISAGGNHTCARKKDGTLWCWGSDQDGELGDGNVSVDSPSPIEVSALGHDVADVVAGRNTCARKTDGTLWCWGNNVLGQVGDGTRGGVTCGTQVCRSSPQQVVGSIGEAAANVGLSFSHTCAVGRDSSLWCWGDNSGEELGIGNVGLGDCAAPIPGPSCEASPQQVTALGNNAVAVVAGTGQTCALLLGGLVWCWGSTGNSSSLLLPPTRVTSIDEVVQVASGGALNCALKQEGSVWCWQTGGQVSRVDAIAKSAAEIAVSGDGICARKSDGSVWCWGNNGKGQLGDGTTNSSNVPVRVAALPAKAVQISAGDANVSHSCALLQDGSAWCWGSNEHGQLGDGTTNPTLTPVRVQICP